MAYFILILLSIKLFLLIRFFIFEGVVWLNVEILILVNIIGIIIIKGNILRNNIYINKF